MRNNNRVQSERFWCEVRALPKLFSNLHCDWGRFIDIVGGKKVKNIFISWFVNIENVYTYILTVLNMLIASDYMNEFTDL